MTRRRLWVVGGLAAWALVLGVLAVVSHRTDEPTVREQRDVAAAMRIVSEALGNSVAQAGPDAVPVITPITVDKGCRITPFRDGATATGVVRFFTKDAAGLLGRLGTGYPAAYEAEVSADGKALRADAGEFVALRGKVISAGEVQVTVTTGCRPTDVDLVSLLPERPEDALPGEVLSVLGATSVEAPTVAFGRCPSGEPATTASAVGHGVKVDPATAREHDKGVAVVDTAEVYAYRRGAREAVAVLPASDDDARVYVTKLC
ncbi:hypothetical protein AB0J82_39740 [Asanoa sp. NPDC049518]|uniref:hypothetical protein n=1 Tax=unclassified Asanoa TaxID=2685164 RepID=UPI0034170F19